ANRGFRVTLDFRSGKTHGLESSNFFRKPIESIDAVSNRERSPRELLGNGMDPSKKIGNGSRPSTRFLRDPHLLGKPSQKEYPHADPNHSRQARPNRLSVLHPFILECGSSRAMVTFYPLGFFSTSSASPYGNASKNGASSASACTAP